MEILNHPRRLLHDLHFLRGPFCHFDIVIIPILSVRQFGLKMSIHSPEMGVDGFDLLNGGSINETPKMHTIA